MKRIAIIGSGALANQISHLIRLSNAGEIIGYFDDFLSKETSINNLPVLGPINSIHHLFERNMFDQLVMAVGYNHRTFRSELFNRLNKDIPFATIVHPTTYIDPSAQVGAGCVIYSGCTIDMGTIIGNNTLIYNDCTLAHDNYIGDHSILCPSVKVAGFNKIGENVLFGVGTIISDQLEIISGITTGAGTIITKSISVEGVYVGSPAKNIKK